MRKRILTGILLFSLLTGFGTAAGIASRHLEDAEDPERVAFWSLIYERPNPERLPVKVTFRFL